MRNLHAMTLTAATLLAAAGAAWAQPPAVGSDETIAALRDEVAELSARLAELERRLAELAGEPAAPPLPAEAAPAAGELEALRAAAQAAAEAAAAPAPPDLAPGAPAVLGGERNLNRLNPEISYNAIVEGVAGGEADADFDPREFEVDFQSALDPFSRGRLTLAVSEEEGIEVEEGYILYSGLPGGLELKGGKFRQRFGALNQQHLHALPQTDYPLALQAYFGEEGLAQTGVALAWLLPRPWASANQVIFEVTDGESEAFGGESFDHLVGLARLESYWDLSAAAYFEWGLSGATGQAEGDLDTTVLGTDFTFRWQPPARARYRDLTWRAELLRSRRDDPLTGETLAATGGYSYLEAMVRRGWYLGLRYDLVEDPLDPAADTWALLPSVTWWQSEFVRLRAQYGYLEGPDGESDDRFTLQLTWAAGPHKHETY